MIWEEVLISPTNNLSEYLITSTSNMWMGANFLMCLLGKSGSMHEGVKPVGVEQEKMMKRKKMKIEVLSFLFFLVVLKQLLFGSVCLVWTSSLGLAFGVLFAFYHIFVVIFSEFG